ncbi:gamma-glutamylcyclotransferase family protein [Sulfurimonas paralvinellae]|nr:gamma-glutamylcyclotransferase family protein [Sulfurimonas paralvinellae]
MYLFVYGTLKQGFHNHHLLADAEFICNAASKQNYPMVNTEEYFPYLIDNEGHGYNVKGEVYRIDEAILEMLDILEGYPQHYTRREIEVVSLGIDLLAITYFLNEKIEYKDLELLESFE